jgi:anthranilate phosphoribosyltransferase
MKHVSPIRQQLGFRTIFNLLGPLTNPAGAKRQVVGVSAPRFVEPIAKALGALGAERAWSVHGSGMDELTTTGETEVAEWRDGLCACSRSPRRPSACPALPWPTSPAAIPPSTPPP